MTAEPATLQLTYSGLDGEQLQQRWIELGGGAECYVFAASDLQTADQWQRLERDLRRAVALGAARLTMHFPTEDADWVNDRAATNLLLRFCELADQVGAAGVVLHSNQFVQQRDWLDYDLAAARARVVDRLAEVDARLAGWPLWLGLENMPVIGAQGIDYDSIFVYPEDFRPVSDIGSDRLGVTWDVCHWAVTYSTTASIAQLRQQPAPHPAGALPELPIRHIHFASFSGRAMPFWPHECTEGVVPGDGDMDPEVLASVLAGAIDVAKPGVGVVFEVQEPDYVERQNCWRTLDWLRSRPELETRCRPIAQQR